MRIIDHVRGNAVAYLALFVALGGTTAYATHGINLTTSEDIVDGEVKNQDLGDDSVSSAKIQTQAVTTGDLAPNSVTSTRIPAEAVGTSEIQQGSVFNADLAANSITDTRVAADAVGSSEVKPDSLGGGEIVESSLAKVPDADKLDGIDSSDFIQGKGRVDSGEVVVNVPAMSGDIAVGSPVNVAGFGDIFVHCDSNGNSKLVFRALSPIREGGNGWWFNKDGVGFQPFTLEADLADLTPNDLGNYVVVLQVSALDRTATFTATKHSTGSECLSTGQVVSQIRL